MPNLGWSTEEVWTWPVLTITNPSYCEVLTSEIVDVKEDGIENPDLDKAVYFEGKENCV